MLSPLPVRRGRVVALGWGLADQALSSLTNMALGLLAARALGPRAFGAFSLAFATYLIALGTSRALNTEPLVVRHACGPPDVRTGATGSAAGSAIVVGLVAGLVCGVIAAAGGATRGTFIALGLSLPGLLAQDAWRYAHFASGREAQAFGNDLVWAVLLLLLITALSVSGTASAAWYTLAWGTAATGAALFGAAQARVLPRLRGAKRWWKENRDLTPGFLGQFAVSSGALNLTTFAIAAIAGMEAVGSLRAAEILMGPLNVLFLGISLAAVPEGVRLFKRSSAQLRRLCLVLSSTLPVAALLWGMAVYLLPSKVGHVLLKQTWSGALPLILPLALSRAGVGLAAGPATALRALAAANRSFQAEVVAGGLAVAGGTIGAALAGAVGAAWGLALAAPVAAVAWWWHFPKALHQAKGRT